MNKPKHTPGPWAAHEGTRDEFKLSRSERTDHAWVVCTDSNGLPIAEMCLGTPSANARLIAAAPEMLQALKDFVKLREGDLGPDLEPLKAAIKKAEGE